MQLKGNLLHQNNSENENLNALITDLKKKLEDQTEALENLEDLNGTLMVKELTSNKELQEARQEAIKVEYL